MPPSIRRRAGWTCPVGREALFSDTVGFIQKLPTELVAAFRATLEEINEADLILHVVDITHPNVCLQYETVVETLEELGVVDQPVIVALNKIDLEPDLVAVQDATWTFAAVLPFLPQGDRLEALLERVEAVLAEGMVYITVRLPYSRGDLASLFHAQGTVRIPRTTTKEPYSRVYLPRRWVEQFLPSWSSPATLSFCASAGHVLMHVTLAYLVRADGQSSASCGGGAGNPVLLADGTMG